MSIQRTATASVCLLFLSLQPPGDAAPAPQPTPPKLLFVLRQREALNFWAAFSPDGKTLATAARDGSVQLWDVATGKSLLSPRGHARNARVVVFSPDGKTLASGGEEGKPGSQDHAIRVWEISSGKSLFTLARPSASPAFLALAFNPDGKTLLSAGSAGIVLWDLQTRKERLVVHVGKRPEPVKVPPPGFDPLKGPVVEGGDCLGPNCVAFTLEGKPLAVSTNSDTLTIRHLATGKKTVIETGLTSTPDCLAFSPDRRTLAAVAYQSVRLWDVASGKEVTRFKYTTQITAVEFSPDGKMLAVASNEPRPTKEAVRLLEVSSGKVLATLTGHTRGICCVAFSPDGKILASAAGDQTVRVWDISGVRK